MAATATKKRQPPPTALQHLERALDELEAARRQATDDARGGIEAAMERVRQITDDLRTHTDRGARKA